MWAHYLACARGHVVHVHRLNSCCTYAYLCVCVCVCLDMCVISPCICPVFFRHIGHVGWDPNTGFDVSTQTHTHTQEHNRNLFDGRMMKSHNRLFLFPAHVRQRLAAASQKLQSGTKCSRLIPHSLIRELHAEEINKQTDLNTNTCKALLLFPQS